MNEAQKPKRRNTTGLRCINENPFNTSDNNHTRPAAQMEASHTVHDNFRLKFCISLLPSNRNRERKRKKVALQSPSKRHVAVKTNEFDRINPGGRKNRDGSQICHYDCLHLLQISKWILRFSGLVWNVSICFDFKMAFLIWCSLETVTRALKLQKKQKKNESIVLIGQFKRKKQLQQTSSRMTPTSTNWNVMDEGRAKKNKRREGAQTQSQ